MSNLPIITRLGPINLAKWPSSEIEQLKRLCELVLEDRENSESYQESAKRFNAANNALGSTDRGENGLYGNNPNYW